jgi:SagB-type dehydrogenase family enzyme
MKEYRKYLRNQTLPGMSEMQTDQMRGLPLPPIQKPYPKETPLIDLIPPDKMTLGRVPLTDVIRRRRSRRKFKEDPLTIEELSFLLWCTQGIEKLVRNGLLTMRTVPSGGGMHPYETYLLINRVEGIEPGLYRYLALEHRLYRLPKDDSTLSDEIGRICNGQTFVGRGAAVFIWSVRPYRTEWRYGEDSLKDILIGVGHICQNLYLACESIGAGTCAIIAYEQKLLDDFIGVDGYDEIALFLAPVGKVSAESEDD